MLTWQHKEKFKNVFIRNLIFFSLKIDCFYNLGNFKQFAVRV